MKSLMLVATLILAGCTGNSKPTPTVIVADAKPKASALVKQRCAPLPDDIDGDAMGDLYKGYTFLQGLYAECSQRDGAKADWIDSQGM